MKLTPMKIRVEIIMIKVRKGNLCSLVSSSKPGYFITIGSPSLSSPAVKLTIFQIKSRITVKKVLIGENNNFYQY